MTLLKTTLGYRLCAEIARQGFDTGKSLCQIVVAERRLMTPEAWDELFSFERLIDPDAFRESPR